MQNRKSELVNVFEHSEFGVVLECCDLGAVEEFCDFLNEKFYVFYDVKFRDVGANFYFGWVADVYKVKTLYEKFLRERNN